MASLVIRVARRKLAYAPQHQRLSYFDSTGNAKNRHLAFCTLEFLLRPRPPEKAIP